MFSPTRFRLEHDVQKGIIFLIAATNATLYFFPLAINRSKNALKVLFHQIALNVAIIRSHLLVAIHVLDWFHRVKLFNEKLLDLRRRFPPIFPTADGCAALQVTRGKNVPSLVSGGMRD